MTQRRLRIFPDLEALSLAAADALAAQIQAAVQERERCAVVLTGGRTPRRLYELLAGRHNATIPWRQVDLFWGDERYVPYDDPRSNYRLARLALLDHVAVPPENVHPMPTYHADPRDAAAEYEQSLRDYLAGGAARLDVVLLGLADNGHVASLFPHHRALREEHRWVTAVEVPADPPQRLTMTFPIINLAATVLFLVAGEAKARAVARALRPENRVEEVPAAGVVPASGDVTWWLDAAAAAQLPHPEAQRSPE